MMEIALIPIGTRIIFKGDDYGTGLFVGVCYYTRVHYYQIQLILF